MQILVLGVDFAAVTKEVVNQNFDATVLQGWLSLRRIIVDQVIHFGVYNFLLDLKGRKHYFQRLVPSVFRTIMVRNIDYRTPTPGC